MEVGLPNRDLKEMLDFLAKDALERLEWPLFLEHLASGAVFRETRESLLSLEPNIESAVRDRIFSATEEMLEVISTGTLPQLREVDFSAFIPLLRRQSLVAAKGLLELLVFLEQTEEVASFARASRVSGSNARFHVLSAVLSNLTPLSQLKMQLARSIAPDGTILSSASPELRSARDRAENARRQVISSIESMLQKPSIRDALQDPVWVTRDGRIVLPVRVERRGDVDGIPRGVSGSGSTVFVEPREIAVLQSALERAETDVQIEEARVLRTLSDLAATEFLVLDANREAILGFDELAARAKMASLLHAVRPVFLDAVKSKVRFRLRRASHPLFLLEGKECVANDLALEPQFEGDERKNVWVLTGPNAGGKTVAMRTVGIIVVMAKAGLFVPAERAEICDFDRVFVELGDRQSREEDLSTFSGHLVHVSRMFSLASESSLLLLDEGFVGTDPAVGMALARAALEDLCWRNVTTLITTHFSNLKSVANANPGFLNASMEFEPRELRPTYRLITGIPGQSFALELAERIHFPKRILECARGYYGDESHRVELLLAELQEKRFELQRAFDEQAREIDKARREHEILATERLRIQRERDEVVEQYRSKLSRRLNAFENRLAVRERQFERNVSERERELQVSSEKATNEGTSEECVSSSVVEHQESAGKRTNVPANTDSEAPRRITSFAELGKISISTCAKSSDSESNSEMDERAKRFRAPRSHSSRSLLDEARESLEVLDKGFSRIESEFKKDMSRLSGSTDTPPPQKKSNSVVPRQSRLPSYWARGMRVKTPRFKDVGTVLRAVDGKGLVECEFGAVRMRLPHSELLTVEDAATAVVQRNSVARKTSVVRKGVLDVELDGIIPTSLNTVDLRGLTANEGVERAGRFLDQNMRKGEDRFVILHGHGEGRVKAAVREWLASGAYDLKYRPGRPGEGGDGVTVVQLS
jgi:DNA mismatch repair protein MutS2